MFDTLGLIPSSTYVVLVVGLEGRQSKVLILSYLLSFSRLAIDSLYEFNKVNLEICVG